MTDREKKLYELYKLCIENGYSNIDDPTESLKVKVFALDLEIKYKKINDVFEEAKRIYCAEEERLKEYERLQKTEGNLLLSFEIGKEGKQEKSIGVYQREDGTKYYSYSKEGVKYEGVPQVQIVENSLVTYTYHPSKLVFTGASVGGVATGGFHSTNDYYTQRSSKSGKGMVGIEVAGKREIVMRITFSEEVAYLLRNDERYKSLTRTGSIFCYDNSELAKMSFKIANDILLSKDLDFYKKMEKRDMMLDHTFISYDKCIKICNLVGDVLNDILPDDDETIYKKAVSKMEANTSIELKEAIDLFDLILDKNDSANLQKIVEIRYKEILQKEKEEKVLAMEADALRRKKFAKIIGIVLGITAIIVAISIPLLLRFNRLNEIYANAVRLYEFADYEKAYDIFCELGSYSDSESMANECMYKQAQCDLTNEKYESAYDIFDKLGTYADSADMAKKAKYEYGKLCLEAYDYDAAYEIFSFLNDYSNSKEMASYVLEKKDLMAKSKELIEQGSKEMFSDRERTLNLFEEVAEVGNEDAMLLAGYMYDFEGKNYNKQDPFKAREYYEKAVTNPYAKICLAYIEKEGKGCIKDNQKANELFNAAISLIDENEIDNLAYAGVATYLLGKMYEYGDGVEKDYSKALMLYEKSVKLGNSYAMVGMADMIVWAKGTDRDIPKAIEWYEKAIAMGNTEAMDNMATIYKSGKLVDVDIDKALDLYEHAVSLGNYDSLYNLALMHLDGDGVDKERKKAIELLEKAADTKNDKCGKAMFYLGRLYDSRPPYGKALSSVADEAKAVYWYEKAVEVGEELALKFMANRYYYVDDRKANEYYEKAKELHLTHEKTLEDYARGLIKLAY